MIKIIEMEEDGTIINDDKKPEVNKDDKTASKWHTMFKIKVPAKRIQKKKGYFKEKPAYTLYRIFIDDFMEYEKGLHEIWNELYKAGKTDRLELIINSHGGLVHEGMQFFNLIKNEFKGRVTTILDNKAYSTGAMIFCCGDKRIVNTHADFMLHDYSGGAIGKGGEIKSRIKHMSRTIRFYFKELINKPGFLTHKEYKKLNLGKDYWMSTNEMCHRGIATHVKYEGDIITASKYLALMEIPGADKKDINRLAKTMKKDTLKFRGLLPIEK